MREDLQAVFRSLRTSTSFTIAALLVLTLAIGASTALFSVVPGCRADHRRRRRSVRRAPEAPIFRRA